MWQGWRYIVVFFPKIRLVASYYSQDSGKQPTQTPKTQLPYLAIITANQKQTKTTGWNLKSTPQRLYFNLILTSKLKLAVMDYMG
jgi:hypothetical protein